MKSCETKNRKQMKSLMWAYDNDNDKEHTTKQRRWNHLFLKKGCERFLSMLCQQRNASNLQNRIFQTNDNKTIQTNNNMRACKSDNNAK
jgi:hypothetical protein